jgi:hypothetical protein
MDMRRAIEVARGRFALPEISLGSVMAGISFPPFQLAAWIRGVDTA